MTHQFPTVEAHYEHLQLKMKAVFQEERNLIEQGENTPEPQPEEPTRRGASDHPF